MVLHGIDISAYQPDLDLVRVPSDFVIIKATGGPGYVNPAWVRQYDATKAAGKRVGLYHFVRDGWKGTTAAEEAFHFINTIQGRTKDTVLALDWEGDNQWDTVWAGVWLDMITKAFDIPRSMVPVYANYNAIDSYDWGRVVAAGHPLWLSGGRWYDDVIQGYSPPSGQPEVKHWGTPAMWQYTQKGRLPGHSGGLDLNVAYVDLWAKAPTGRELLIPDVEHLYP